LRIAPAVSSRKPIWREISAPRSQRIFTNSRAAFGPLRLAVRKRRALVHIAPSGLTLRATYMTAWGKRLQLTVLKLFLAPKSSAPKRAVTFEALLEQPASFRSRA
jgi:hypothetical protein